MAYAEKPTGLEEKDLRADLDPATPELEHGHLQELEVDVDKVAHDQRQHSIEEDTSPYPEVRSVVPEVDDPTIPVVTTRMVFLGIIAVLIGSGVNQFFSLRQPSVHIPALVMQLLAFPCGVALANILPVKTVSLGRLGSWCINPDRHFNIKEHTLIVIMANACIGFGAADSTQIIQAGAKFYGFQMKTGFNVLVVLTCQMLGFGVAGLSSKWLVEPANIIWPGTLSICALLSTLHSRANAVANGWKITRLRFFLYATTATFIWYWFPGLMFVALSYFTWMCWILPHHRVVNQLFGMQTGLGLSPITFDWSQVAFNTNPLLSPAWAALNVLAGFVVFYWGVVPAIVYTNTWFTGYLPLMTADVYDRFGQVYNVSQVLNQDGSLDLQGYRNYSPPFLGASFAFVYGLSFASITSALVHVYLWHGADIWAAVKGRQPMDIHARLMRSYKKTPWYWYAALTVVIVVLAIVMVEVYDVLLPVYGVFLALVIPAVYMIPCGIIQGLTNVDANQLNVLAEFIGGYMFSGRPMANMVFKYLSVDVVNQGLFFTQDMKLGHYNKVPPRVVFFAQGSATILGALTQVGVTTWMLGHINEVCTEDQSDNFSCPNGRTTYSSSVIWGLIGPSRLYSAGKIYSSLLHFFWLGALMPIVTWLLYKKFPKQKIWYYINWPLIFVGTWNVPPATGINYSSWALVNWIFNWWIMRRFFAWWSKYNYVLAAALDTGTALSAIIIFFCISYPGASFPDWWGNTVYVNTDDGNGIPYLDLPAVGYFGPANGTWT